MKVNYQTYIDKLQDHYYDLVLQQNIEYLDKHGVGPYEYQGKFAGRVVPYFDVNYWHGFDKWLKDDYGVVDNNTFTLEFKNDEDAVRFMLEWA